jgi:exonuclease SbcD
MKILHTADWHLGKSLDSFSRIEEQREVLAEICEIAESQDVDVVLVAGDLFDNFTPSNLASELLYSTLHRLSANGKRAVIAIAGNHDSPERIEVPDALARACGIIFVGFPNTKVAPFKTQQGLEVLKTDIGFVELKLPKHATPLRLLLTPYANELRLKTYLGAQDSEVSLREHLQQHWAKLSDQYCDTNGVNVLVTHLFMMKKGGVQPDEPDDEKSILYVGGASVVYSDCIPPQIQYVALGHLHRFQTIDQNPCPIVYSSSPLAYSFNENNQSKYVVLVDAQANQPVNYQAIELKSGRKLLRNKFDDIDKALAWLADNQNAIVQITLITENYLEAKDKKRLMDAHSGLMPIIPEIRAKKGEAAFDQKEIKSIDGQRIEDIFVSYFQHKKGQSPNSNILGILKEILATELEEKN